MSRKTPLYQAIFEELRRRIAAHEWTIGAPFPSEAEISEAYKASRITVRHALRLLETDGLIRKAAARRSTVVAHTPLQPPPFLVKSVDDIIAQVADASLRVFSWKPEFSPENAKLLDAPPRSRLPCLRAALVRNGAPFLRSIIYFPPDIGGKLRQADFDDVVVFRVLGHRLGVFLEDVHITVWPELATPDDAAILKCDVGAPLLVTQLLYHSGGRPVELAYSRRCGVDARFSTIIAATPDQRP